MNNQNDSENGVTTKNFNERIREILIMVLVAFSLIGALLLIITKFLIPFPLAEVAVMAYYYGISGQIAVSLVFALFYISVLAFCAIMCKPSLRKKRYLKVLPSVFLILDIIAHIIAFMLSSGYQWNYLFSALFDVALVFCILFERKRVSV